MDTKKTTDEPMLIQTGGLCCPYCGAPMQLYGTNYVLHDLPPCSRFPAMEALELERLVTMALSAP